MNSLRLLLASISFPMGLLAQTPAGSPFAPGATTLFAADFSAAGAMPQGVLFIQGTPGWGQQNGLAMLRAPGPTQFTVTLPDVLPQHFTIEADLFTNSTAAGYEFAVQGNAGLTGTTRSALVVWHHAYAAVFRGGAAAGDKYFYPPAALLPELRNQVVHIQIVMDGTHFTLFTNDEQLADIPDLVFKRDKFLVVYLGGAPLPNGEVYLAKLRIGSNTGAAGPIAATQSASTAGGSGGGAPAPPSSGGGPPAGGASSGGGLPAGASSGVVDKTGLIITVDAQGAARASWNALPGGATYLAMRWKVGDVTCCNNNSPPGAPLTSTSWQDGPLPGTGTYRYRVIAMSPMGLGAAEAQVTWTGTIASSIVPAGSGPVSAPATPAPGPAPTPVQSSPAAPGLPKAAGGIPNRNTPLPPPAAAAANPNLDRTITLAGFSATGGFGRLAPRTITLAGFSATGGFGRLAPRTITLAGFSATGGFGRLAPRTITLPGWTAVGLTGKP